MEIVKKNDGGEVMRKNSRRNMAAGTAEKIADTIGNNMKDI